MNNILVFCQTDGNKLYPVGLELLTKARDLAAQLGCEVDAVVAGSGVSDCESELRNYGAHGIFIADDNRLKNYLTLPYTRIVCHVAELSKPQAILIGATACGRDLAPRVAATLRTGITADCTALEVGDYTDKSGREFHNLLLQIRPSFVQNQLTTIVSPTARPQMATIRQGVMKSQPLTTPTDGKTTHINTESVLRNEDFALRVISRTADVQTNDLATANVIVAGGYGVGSRENFGLLEELAKLLGGQTGATRAAVDAGFTTHDRMIGQTGLTVSPKLYIACGISGQVQHTVGMERSGVIVSINNDPEAPICHIADYAITGDVKEVVTKLIELIKRNRR